MRRMNNPALITQARMGSTRLPDKVLMQVQGKPLLAYHLERLQWSGLPVIIATSTEPQDAPIVAFAQAHKIPCFRGDELNVLSRFYYCARALEVDPVVRISSDCPLIDGHLIRQAVDQYLAWDDPCVYYSNGRQRTFPIGFDFEIFSFALLAEAFENAVEEIDLEHVTPYINRNRSGRVAIRHVLSPDPVDRYRLTVDTPNDLTLIQTLIRDFGAAAKDWREILTILRAHPHLEAINGHIDQQ